MGIYIPWLVDAARMAVAGTGAQVIVAPGLMTRGHGGLRVVEIVVGHHTGTPDSAAGDYPSLRIVRDGRADLAGPLSNYGLGRSGNVYVIAAGLCYHAGASAFAGYTDLNDEAIGIEAESAGGGRWTDAQLLIYPRLVGACLLYMRRGTSRYASHRTVARPAGRKPDPTGISDDWMRQHAAAFLAAPTAATAEVKEEKEEPMIHIEHLPPTPDNEFVETVIALPWQGGITGATKVYAMIAAANSAMTLQVAHWQIHNPDGSHGFAPMVPNGTVIQGLANSGGQPAPVAAYSLVLDYNSALGGSVIIEAAR
jgi:hypothetical protein